MRQILLFLPLLLLFTSNCWSEPLEPIRFPAYVVKLEESSATIRVNGNLLEIPRSALPSKVKTKEINQVSLDFDDYKKIRTKFLASQKNKSL